MASQDDTNPKHGGANGSPGKHASDAAPDKPDWADGLKQLYDSVVEEPLPDSFRDLLEQLDEGDGSSAQRGDQP